MGCGDGSVVVVVVVMLVVVMVMVIMGVVMGSYPCSSGSGTESGSPVQQIKHNK